MYPLKLPEFEPRIQGEEKKEIFCLVRRKFVALTPEEWVRQHFLNLLISYLNYPKGLIRLEHSINYFRNAKRSDITVLDTDGNIFLLVECKSHKVQLDQKVLNQLAEYNKVLDSRFLAISNGMKHFIWERMGEEFVQKEDFPAYHGT